MKFGIESNWFDGKFDVIFIYRQVILLLTWKNFWYMKPVFVFLESKNQNHKTYIVTIQVLLQ